MGTCPPPPLKLRCQVFFMFKLINKISEICLSKLTKQPFMDFPLTFLP